MNKKIEETIDVLCEYIQKLASDKKRIRTDEICSTTKALAELVSANASRY